MRRLALLRTTAALATAALALALAGPAGAERYVVLYKLPGQADPALAKVDLALAGGTLVAGYPEIGVVVAESESPTFLPIINSLKTVIGAAPTGGTAGDAGAEGEESGGWAPTLPSDPVADNDTFSPLQWWSGRISAPAAHAVTGGNRDVLVGVIDTGADRLHPDLDDNIDVASSASCVTGAANPSPSAWADNSGHGSNVAGIIGAESNGRGIVGIAPRVRLAIIKAGVPVGNRDVFLPEAVICSLVWAAKHGVAVANNSYSVDSRPVGGTTSFCRSIEEQRTIYKAVKRAVEYALGAGVAMVASAGNDGIDLADPARTCSRLPSELPGVLTVSSIGLQNRLAAGPPSNYGLGVVSVAAPGGDFLQGAPPSGLVLGGWPAAIQVPRLLCDPCEGPGAGYYSFFAGTSQAAAQVSGVAALVVSRFGKPGILGGLTMTPSTLAEIVKATADPLPCPAADARCVDDGSQTSFFGKGVVNALRAIHNRRGDP